MIKKMVIDEERMSKVLLELPTKKGGVAAVCDKVS